MSSSKSQRYIKRSVVQVQLLDSGLECPYVFGDILEIVKFEVRIHILMYKFCRHTKHEILFKTLLLEKSKYMYICYTNEIFKFEFWNLTSYSKFPQANGVVYMVFRVSNMRCIIR